MNCRIRIRIETSPKQHVERYNCVGMVEELTAQGGTNRLELQNQPKTINKDMKLTLYQVTIFPTGTSFYYLQFGISSGCYHVVEWLAALIVSAN
jgi:hypothetical protein